MFNRRRSLIAILAVMVISVLATGVLIAAEKKQIKAVAWQTDFTKASKAASKSNKPMMVDFYTTWCGWCKKLDSDTYTNSQVVELSQKFVTVKVDGDKYPDLVKKYKVNGYPTIVFLNSKGNEVSRVVGFQNANDFAKSMQSALNKAK